MIHRGYTSSLVQERLLKMEFALNAPRAKFIAMLAASLHTR